MRYSWVDESEPDFFTMSGLTNPSRYNRVCNTRFTFSYTGTGSIQEINCAAGEYYDPSELSSTKCENCDPGNLDC